MRTRLFRLLLDPTPAEGNGGTNPPPADKGPDLTKAIEGLLVKHGDAAGALRVLLAENHGYRDQLRETKAKLPAEGSVVLTGDDVKAWGDYRQIGKPEDLRTGLTERDAVKAELTGLRKAETDRTAAELHGMKPGVLATLAKNLTLVVKEDKGKDGKAVRVAHVQGDGDATTPLTEYAETHWADFLPSLKAEAPARTGPAPRTGHTLPRPEITPAAPRKRFGGI